MKTTTLRRMLAAIMAAIMALCVLTGCTKEPAQQTDPQNVGTSLPVGMFILTAGASVNVRYDIDGLAVEVTGNDENGLSLAENYTDYLGKTCADVVKDLIAAATNAAYLTPKTKNIVIKQVANVPLPGTDFLGTIESAVKAAAEEIKSTAVITLVSAEKLDEDGNINFETAQALLCNELGVEKLDAYYGLSTPTDGAYICTAEIAGVQTYHSIDAATGLIAEATEEELMGPDQEFMDEDTEDDYWDDEPAPVPEDEVYHENTTATVPDETEAKVEDETLSEE